MGRLDRNPTRTSAATAPCLLLLLLLAGCTARQARPDLADTAGRVDGPLQQHAAAACAAQRAGTQVPAHDFTTDGCSLWPDGTWAACCVEHDAAYWCGGDADDRRDADIALYRCVSDCCSGNMGRLMYLGVRVGGIPWQPFPWRWAYGFDGIRGYDDLRQGK